ncbi:MAG TPA: hypothetical protein PKY22_07480 [Accumulibacter sp.]|nr:hypothetical protein [Accumulibacter sp.]
MKSALLTRRQILVLSLGMVGFTAIASAAPAITAVRNEPAYTLSGASGQSLSSIGQQSTLTVVTSAAGVDGHSPSVNRDSIDHTRWNHGGDANANDIALFRQVLTFGTNGSEAAATSGGLLALLVGGLLLGQRLRKRNSTKSRQQSFFPVHSGSGLTKLV